MRCLAIVKIKREKNDLKECSNQQVIFVKAQFMCVKFRENQLSTVTIL